MITNQNILKPITSTSVIFTYCNTSQSYKKFNLTFPLKSTRISTLSSALFLSLLNTKKEKFVFTKVHLKYIHVLVFNIDSDRTDDIIITRTKQHKFNKL